MTTSNKNNKRLRSDENWVRAYWRPAMAWLYGMICFCDFILFPVLYQVAQYYAHQTFAQYVPITLSNGGLIHLSFGTIVGINAHSRGKELLAKTMQESAEPTNV
jgi:hypothetical protein